jgi:hypothetical protein
MDNEYPPEAWRRLGRALEAWRGQMGYGFRQREKFLAERGGPPPSLKTLARLERGERTFYPEGTLARLESLYGYAPGSFEAILAGGEGKPLELEHSPARPVLRAVPAVPGLPSERLAQEVLSALLKRYPGDTVVQAMGAQPGKPASAALLDILRFLDAQGPPPASPAGDILAGLPALKGDQVIEAIATQPHKYAVPRMTDVLDWLRLREPQAQAGEGIVGLDPA